MKKYFFLTLFFTSIILFAFIYKQKKEPTLVQKDKDIVIVNISDYNRDTIAKIIEKVQSYEPKLVLLDIFFQKDEGLKDTILVNTLCDYGNIIMAYGYDGETHFSPSLPKFKQCAKDSGYCNSFFENKCVKWFVPKYDSFSHISLTTAKQYDTSTNVSNLKNKEKIEIKFSNTLNDFNPIESKNLLDQSFSDGDVFLNKIVILGYTGPSDEDKFQTPMKYSYKDIPEGKPDTYGCVILANIIRQILDDY